MSTPVYVLLDGRSVLGEPSLDHLLEVLGENQPTVLDLQDLRNQWGQGVVVKWDRDRDDVDVLEVVTHL